MISAALFCLASAVYHESRGESEIGQLAVAIVILNRVSSHQYPDSVCEVVRQPGQFAFVWDDIPDIPLDPRAWELCAAVAAHAIDVWTDLPRDRSVMYFKASDYWPGMEHVAVIGGHHFFR